MIIPIQHIPEVTSVLDIMTMFTRQKNNIAVVVDEFGGTAGIITLEDITEEIFGEIEDEHDQEDYLEEKISETEYLFSARLEIDYLNTKSVSYTHLTGTFQGPEPAFDVSAVQAFECDKTIIFSNESLAPTDSIVHYLWNFGAGANPTFDTTKGLSLIHI